MAGKIFVNYRRDDSAANALNVAQYLEREFGARNVFLDIDRMRAGQDFPSVLKDKLSACKVMIAVIGPTWLTIKGDDGKRRLDDPEDWVRLEIAHALQRNIAVIPVLVGGAALPKKADLPDDLKPLLQRHVATITTNGFRHEMAGLARDIKAIPGETKPWGKIAAGAAALALGGYVAAYAAGAPVWWPGVPGEGGTTKGYGNFPISVGPPDAPKPKNRIEQKTAPAPNSEPGKTTANEPPVPNKPEDKVKLSVLPAPSAPPAMASMALNAPPAVPAAADPATKVEPGSGKSFRDCPDVCPEMVVVPKGEFIMGAIATDDEKPPHTVTIARPFAVGKFAVTFAEWDACVAEGGCLTKPSDEGWGRDKRPAINVSWDDVTNEFLPWLKKKTGKPYRLLTEAEWEYAATAGTTTKYPWGDEIGKGKANCNGCGSQWDGKQTAPVGSFEPNTWGLYDMHGNVSQSVQDCNSDSYKAAPNDGSAAIEWAACRRVVRGGSWISYPSSLRSAHRYWGYSSNRNRDQGFRVGRTLTP